MGIWQGDVQYEEVKEAQERRDWVPVSLALQLCEDLSHRGRRRKRTKSSAWEEANMNRGWHLTGRDVVPIGANSSFSMPSPPQQLRMGGPTLVSYSVFQFLETQ